MHIVGVISGAHIRSPPSIATMAQSHGVPSREKILRGGPSGFLIASARSSLSSNLRSWLSVSLMPEQDCSLAGASTTIGYPLECNSLIRTCSPLASTPSSLVRNRAGLSMKSGRLGGSSISVCQDSRRILFHRHHDCPGKHQRTS